MIQKGSGIAELKDRLQKGADLSLVEKAELCLYGRNYTAKEWSREYTPEELGELWRSRDSEKLHEIAELAEAKARIEQVWNPNIGDLETIRDERGLCLDAFQNLRDATQAIFYGYDFRDDSQRVAYYERYKHETYRHQLATAYGWQALKICHAALHPVWLGVLCFSRQTRPLTDADLRNWQPWVDWMPQDGAYVQEGPEAFRLNFAFRGLEELTEPAPITSGELQKRLADLGLKSDLKSIREAADGLGISLSEAKRGFKAGEKSKRLRISRKKSKRK